jgi:hypothetical protein
LGFIVYNLELKIWASIIFEDLQWERSTNCSLHCRLAKFRGLMIRGKYGAVIGRETHFWYMPSINFKAYKFMLANNSAVFPLDRRTTAFCQTAV